MDTPIYGTTVLDYIGFHRASIDNVAIELGISATAIAGAIANELNAQINLSPVQSFLNSQQDNFVGQFSSLSIILDFQEAYTVNGNSVTQNVSEGFIDRILHVSTNDIGPGNIEIGTGIAVVQQYVANHPDSDPLDLKQYSGNWDNFVSDLVEVDNSLTIRIAALVVQQAEDYFQTNAPDTWNNLTPAEQDALVVTYYKRGFDSIEASRQEQLALFGDYVPQPGTGSEEFFANEEAIVGALGGVENIPLDRLLSGLPGLDDRSVAGLNFIRSELGIDEVIRFLDVSDNSFTIEVEPIDDALPRGTVTIEFLGINEANITVDSVTALQNDNASLDITRSILDRAVIEGNAVSSELVSVLRVNPSDIVDATGVPALEAIAYEVRGSAGELHTDLLSSANADARNTLVNNIIVTDLPRIADILVDTDIPFQLDEGLFTALNLSFVTAEGAFSQLLEQGDISATSTPVFSGNGLAYQTNPDGSFALDENGDLIPNRLIGFDTVNETTDERAEVRFGADNVTQIRLTGDGSFDLIVTTDADGNVSVDVTIEGTNISLGRVGSIFGTHIGRLISDDPFAQIGAGTVIGAATSVLFETTGLLLDGRNLDQSISAVVQDLDTTIASNAVGAVSGFLFSELLAELGIEGVAAQAFSTTAGTAITSIVDNIVVDGATTFADAIDGINPSDIAGGAFTSFGSFLGSALANEVVTIDSPEELAAASLGGALGSYVATAGLSSFVSGLGVVGGLLTGGLGAFVGTVIGDFIITTILGTPESGRQLIFDEATGEFVFGSLFSNDGADENIPDDLANIALPVLNSVSDVLENSRIDIANIEFVAQGAYGQFGSDLAFYSDGANSDAIRGSDPIELVNAALFQTLSGLVLSGGDIFLKRAYYRTLEEAQLSSEALLDNDLNFEGGLQVSNFNPVALISALAIARDYSTYQQNFAVIDAIAREFPNSVFAAGQALTVLQGQELGLDQAHISDLFGGLGGYIDSIGFQLDNVALDAVSVTIIDGDGDGLVDDLELSFSANGLEPLVLSDFTDTYGFNLFTTVGTAGTRIGTVNSDVLILSEAAGAANLQDSPDAEIPTDAVLVDTNGNSILSDDIFVGNSFANVLDGGAGGDFLDGNGGDDTLQGGADNDVLLGRDGDDVLNGGDDDDYLSGGLGADSLSGGNGDDTLVGSPIGERDTLDGGAGIDTGSYELSTEGVYVDLNTNRFNPSTADVLTSIENVTGSLGNDYIIGSGGANELNGLDGSDFLVGGNGNDTLVGGADDDHLAGGAGNDLYVFNPGDGQDYIEEDGGFDQIFIDGYLPDDVTIRRATFDTADSSGEVFDIVISFAGSTDQITIEAGILGGDPQIEEIIFSDGTIWTIAEIRDRIATQKLPIEDEVIRGTSGADTLEGGAGNDVLAGFGGNDTYIFNRGDGRDAIEDSGQGARANVGDTLQINGYTLDEISFERVGNGNSNDLIIRFEGTDDQIIIYNQLGRFGTTNSYGDRIEEIVLEDGTRLNADQIQALVIANQATSGNDIVLGTNDDDTITGGEGNDFLFGGGDRFGGDTYVFARGGGEDVILPNRFNNNDSLVINGYTADEISFSRLTPNTNDLLITFNGTDDRIIVRATLFAGSNPQSIDSITLDDGTVISRAEFFALALESATTDEDNNIQGIIGFGDTIVGGLGNDFLNGRSGNDTYIFSAGDGQDRIEEGIGSRGGGSDRVIFSDYLFEDAILTRSGDSLTIGFVGSTDQVAIRNALSIGGNPGAGAIEFYEFADGTVLTSEEIRNILTTGTDEGERITGFSRGNIITGNGGNDTLVGGSGGDVYVFNAGDGQDIIDDNGVTRTGGDRIVLEDYTANQTSFAVDPANAANLIISFVGSNDTITILNTLSGSRADTIETIEFADGATASIGDVQNLLNNVAATDGDDSLTGFVTADILEGGLGNDTLEGLEGSDTYIFSVGDDQDLIIDSGIGDTDTLRIQGYVASDLIFATDAADPTTLIISFAGTSDQITIQNGLAGASPASIEQVVLDDGTALTPTDIDLIVNGDPSPEPDSEQIGTAAADLLTGGTGNDLLDGGPGDDTLIGGLGNDTLVPGSGSNNLSGGDGDDIFRYVASGFNNGFNEVNGGAGNDTIEVTQNDTNIRFLGDFTPANSIETIDATGLTGVRLLAVPNSTTDLSATTVLGEIVIDGSTGADTIVGSAGDDTIVGRTGANNLSGSAGDDTFLFNATAFGNGLNTLDGGDGFDRILVSADGAFIQVSGDFSAASNSIEQIDVSGVLGTELFTSVNSVTDLSGIDVLGELMIQGSTGNDTIIGSSGNDTIAGDGGLNNLSGGAGDDTFIFERGGSGNGTNIINGGLGFDRIQITQNDTLIRFSGGFDASNSLEQIDATGLTGTRVIISESNVVHDFSATTILGAVTIVGSTGDDTIVGSTADDTIVGNGGLNNLSGGGGDDVFLLDRSGFGNGANILDGGLGFDQVQVTANDAFIRFSGGFDASNSIEQIDASGVTGTIVNIFQSNVVHDFSSTTILGDVIVRGSTGADTIIGSSGNDNIEGSVGNDQIAGGVGDDLLTGGVGADIFVFDAGFGSDTITDFEGGLDSLDFTGTGLTFNDLSISQVGTDTVIDDGLGNTITLIGITATTIDQNDFLF